MAGCRVSEPDSFLRPIINCKVPIAKILQNPPWIKNLSENGCSLLQMGIFCAYDVPLGFFLGMLVESCSLGTDVQSHR